MALQHAIFNHDKYHISYPHQSEESDWSNLPPDLLYLISRKLTDVFDFVRFRAVCNTWRSAVRASDLAPQLPWIFAEFPEFDEGCLRFYSLLTGKTHIISFPPSSNKSITGSAYNYLFCFNSRNRNCSLVNPLTNEEIALPQATTLNPSCIPSSMYPDQSLRYVGISGPPYAIFTNPSFCRLGDLSWTTICGDRFLTKPSVWYNSFSFSHKLAEVDNFKNMGFALYDGICYATDRETGSTKVFNLATQTLVYIVPHPEADLRGFFIYLVVSFGEILRVCQYKRFSITETCYFVIYRLKLGNGGGNATNPCWIKIDTIGNQFLFLHENHGCAFRADDFPGFVANSIYFTKQVFVDDNIENMTFELSRYDIKERTVQVLAVPAGLGSNWFVPSLC